MTRPGTRRRALLLPALALVLALLAACGGTSGSDPASSAPTLRISSIPDQDQDKLAARDGAMAEYLGSKLGVKAEYVPVTDYSASVTLFRTGDLDLVFYGGLTGVQARLQTPDSTLIAQRDIDDDFRSVFIASIASGVQPFSDVAGLSALKGKRVTFGSESSTSGRLMPEYFLRQAGVASRDLAGEIGFSGSHDATINLVTSATYEVGALNSQVWESRMKEGRVEESKVRLVFTSPPYHDYHWIAGPSLDQRLGGGTADRVKAAMLELSTNDPAQKALLEQYGAQSFIPTTPENYGQIEEIARELGLLG